MLALPNETSGISKIIFNPLTLICGAGSEGDGGSKETCGTGGVIDASPFILILISGFDI